jgi:hypothetical protein
MDIKTLAKAVKRVTYFGIVRKTYRPGECLLLEIAPALEWKPTPNGTVGGKGGKRVTPNGTVGAERVESDTKTPRHHQHQKTPDKGNPSEGNPSKGEGTPMFEPVKKNLFPKEYDQMAKGVEARIGRIKAEPGSWYKDLSDEALENIRWLEREKPDGWQGQVEDIKQRQGSFVLRLTAQAKAMIKAHWQQIDEIMDVKLGVKK